MTAPTPLLQTSFSRLMPPTPPSSGGSPMGGTIPILVSVLGLLVALPLSATAGDWMTVGGNSRHDGLSDEVGPSAPDVLWDGSVNALFGGQCYTDGERLATMRFQTIHVSPIVGYDLADGTALWSVDFPGTNSRSVPRGMRDGKVYATNFQETGADTLYALDADTGAIVWKSEVFCERGIIWGAVFADDGDLVVPSVGNAIARVEHTDGSRVWSTPRIIPNTGAEGLAVFGNTVYGFEGSIVTPKVLTAWDLATGAKKYSSPGLPGDGDQENPLTVGPDGTIYVKRDGGLLYAFTDTGVALVEKWAVAEGSLTYGGHFAVGQDGSLYVPEGTALLRLDPANGAVLDTSGPLITSSTTLNPRVAVSADGRLFVGNGGGGDGRLYCLTPELGELWSRAVPNMVYGGPALGQSGVLAVAGGGTFLEVYAGDPADIADGEADGIGGGPGREPAMTGPRLTVGPNPFQASASLHFRLAEPGFVRLTAFDPGGREVTTVFAGDAGRGEHVIEWSPGHGDGAAVFFLRLETPEGVTTARATRLR